MALPPQALVCLILATTQESPADGGPAGLPIQNYACLVPPPIGFANSISLEYVAVIRAEADGRSAESKATEDLSVAFDSCV